MSEPGTGVVSVVTVNYKGAEDTITCLQSLRELAWPTERLQVICVDNASGDGSPDRIAAAVPEVELVCSSTNTGFTGGCAQGVARATGEYIAFLNNDARPHPDWLSTAVEVLAADPTIGCVASKILDWDGTQIDFVGGGVNWMGHAFQNDFREPDDGRFDEARDVLFACGAAMVVRADLYRAVGGFDDRYFMFFEDVDFGWRLNMLGQRVRFVPTSLVYHRHHGSIGKQKSHYHQFLCERNALMSIYKNFDDETLSRTFGPAVALTVARCFWLGRDDTSALDLGHAARVETETLEVSTRGLSGAFAVDSMLTHLGTLQESRRDLQARRVRSDRDLIELFGDPLGRTTWGGGYQETREALVAAFGIDDLFSRPANHPAADPAAEPAETPEELLERYRLAAAKRAKQTSDLALEVEQARRDLKAVERKLKQAQNEASKLRARVEKRPAKEAPGSTPAARPTLQRQARRVARKMIRVARGARPTGTKR